MSHHLLQIDSSFQGERSVSRRLTARAAANWRAAHPEGTVTYRDLAADPLPHFTGPDSHALGAELIEEVKQATTVILALPVYNFGAPSSVKAWVDHLVVPGVSVDPATGTGLLGGRELIVLGARGGGYAPGTPREGWDHASAWLPHGLSYPGLEPTRIIIAELTLADVVPAMADLRELAAESLANAEREIDELWAPVTA